MFFERPLIVRFLSRLQRPLVGAEELRRSWRYSCGAAKQQLVLERLPFIAAAAAVVFLAVCRRPPVMSVRRASGDPGPGRTS